LLDGIPKNKHVGLELRKKHKIMIHGPNGIGKSTLLKRLVNAYDADAMIHEGVRVGYYSQDFSALDLDMIVWDALHEMSNEVTDQDVYKIAS
jgi:ATPase subunit of ABC transporter with duplicated ATPase domains